MHKMEPPPVTARSQYAAGPDSMTRDATQLRAPSRLRRTVKVSRVPLAGFANNTASPSAWPSTCLSTSVPGIEIAEA